MTKVGGIRRCGIVVGCYISGNLWCMFSLCMRAMTQRTPARMWKCMHAFYLAIQSWPSSIPQIPDSSVSCACVRLLFAPENAWMHAINACVRSMQSYMNFFHPPNPRQICMHRLRALIICAKEHSHPCEVHVGMPAFDLDTLACVQFGHTGSSSILQIPDSSVSCACVHWLFGPNNTRTHAK